VLNRLSAVVASAILVSAILAASNMCPPELKLITAKDTEKLFADERKQRKLMEKAGAKKKGRTLRAAGWNFRDTRGVAKMFSKSYFGVDDGAAGGVDFGAAGLAAAGFGVAAAGAGAGTPDCAL
jgi:hypothetical protein